MVLSLKSRSEGFQTLPFPPSANLFCFTLGPSLQRTIRNLGVRPWTTLSESKGGRPLVFMYIVQVILLFKFSLKSNLYFCQYDRWRIKRSLSSFSLIAFLSISHCMSNFFLYIFISYIIFITVRSWLGLNLSSVCQWASWSHWIKSTVNSPSSEGSVVTLSSFCLQLAGVSMPILP